MLDRKIESVNVGEDGKFTGVTSGGETVRAKRVIGDPSYFGAGKEMEEGGKVRVVETGKVIRAICILKHPIPGTDDSDSAQIIIPQNQVGRKNGKLFISVLKSKLTCRHLHCGCICFAQCSSQGCLDRRSIHHRRDFCPRARDSPRSPAPRNSRRQVCPFSLFSPPFCSPLFHS
jgi:hypothetical protein